jgi:hypothetical protein
MAAPQVGSGGTGSATRGNLNNLQETPRPTMRTGTACDREDVIPALARDLGVVRVTDTIRRPRMAEN